MQRNSKLSIKKYTLVICIGKKVVCKKSIKFCPQTLRTSILSGWLRCILKINCVIRYILHIILCERNKSGLNSFSNMVQTTRVNRSWISSRNHKHQILRYCNFLEYEVLLALKKIKTNCIVSEKWGTRKKMR